MAEETTPAEATSVSGLGMALGGYTVLFVLKLITYFVTGVGVMYAEALHSLADMLISGFLLVAALWSRKPADQQYRFTAVEALRESINKLFGGEASEYSNLTLAIVVTLIAIVISAFPLAKIWRGKEKGAAARAQFVESINDEVALLAALAGILLVANGVPAADGIASLVVAGVIAVNAGSLWWENAQDLMGRSPEKQVYTQIEDAARSVKGVLDLHDLRAEMLGGQVHLEMHISVARGTPIEEADRIAGQVEAQIGKHVRHAYCTIHADPAEPGKSATTQPDLVPTSRLELEKAHDRTGQ